MCLSTDIPHFVCRPYTPTTGGSPGPVQWPSAVHPELRQIALPAVQSRDGRRPARQRPSVQSAAIRMADCCPAGSCADHLCPVRRAVSVAFSFRLAIGALGRHSRGHLLPDNPGRAETASCRPCACCVLRVVEACPAQQQTIPAHSKAQVWAITSTQSSEVITRGKLTSGARFVGRGPRASLPASLCSLLSEL
jgi:hypothetical protein